MVNTPLSCNRMDSSTTTATPDVTSETNRASDIDDMIEGVKSSTRALEQAIMDKSDTSLQGQESSQRPATNTSASSHEKRSGSEVRREIQFYAKIKSLALKNGPNSSAPSSGMTANATEDPNPTNPRVANIEEMEADALMSKTQAMASFFSKTDQTKLHRIETSGKTGFGMAIRFNSVVDLHAVLASLPQRFKDEITSSGHPQLRLFEGRIIERFPRTGGQKMDQSANELSFNLNNRLNHAPAQSSAAGNLSSTLLLRHSNNGADKNSDQLIDLDLVPSGGENDMKDWLELTNFHNEPYRNKKLSIHRRRTRLEAEDAELDLAMQAEAGKRNLTAPSSSFPAVSQDPRTAGSPLDPTPATTTVATRKRVHSPTSDYRPDAGLRERSPPPRYFHSWKRPHWQPQRHAARGGGGGHRAPGSRSSPLEDRITHPGEERGRDRHHYNGGAHRGDGYGYGYGCDERRSSGRYRPYPEEHERRGGSGDRSRDLFHARGRAARDPAWG